MAIGTMLQLFAKIFFMIGVGYFLRRRNIITESLKQGLNFLIVNVFMPFSILASGNNPFSKEMSENLLLAALLIAAYYALSTVLGIGISKVAAMEKKCGKIFVLLQCYANVGFLGIPLAEEMFGTTGTLVAAIYNLLFNLFFFTHAIYYLDDGGKVSLRQMFGNVVTLSSIAAVIIYCSPFRFPAVVADTIQSMGNCTTPLSMLIVGCSFAEIRMRDVLKSRDAYIVSALRLVIYPLLFLAAARAVGLDSTVAAAGVLLTAMPAATVDVIVAEERGCAPEFAAQSVVQSMVLMLITVPVIMMLG